MARLTSAGKSHRLSRLFDVDSGRSLIVPVDDSLIAGPIGGLAGLAETLRAIAGGRPNGVLGFPGHFEQHADLLSSLGWICNLTASTTRSVHTRKVPILTVRQAMALGVDCVAAHVNTTSRFESEMLQSLAVIIADARDLAVPVLAIMYPRREHGDDRDDNYESERTSNPEFFTELVCHAVRVAKDLGADVVKTQYTGSVESFREVVASAKPLPVLIAGGPVRASSDALRMASDALSAGAAGVSFGRNVHSVSNTGAMVRALRGLVHEGLSCEAALDLAGVDEL